MEYSQQKINFLNGIYDLDKKMFNRFDNKNSIINVGYDYDPDNNKYCQEIDIFLEQIMPDKETREYVLDVVSQCLSGNNNLGVHHILIGSEKNDKSVFANLIMKTFGRYFAAYERDCTIKSDFRNIRVGFFEEINSGFMKLLVGGDSLCYTDKEECHIYKPEMQVFSAPPIYIENV